MQRVILILFSYAGIDNINAYLAEILHNGDFLYVGGIIIEGISPSFSSLISDLGFLGDKVVNDVQEAAAGIYRKNAGKQLARIEKKFSNSGVKIMREKISDQNLERIDRIIDEQKISKGIVNYTRNEYITHTDIDFKVKELFNNGKIPVEIYYDGEKN